MIYKRIVAVALFILGCSSVYSMQEESYIKHTVVKGETIYQIGRIYNVHPSLIMSANPSAADGIEVDDVIIVPSTKVFTAKKEASTTSAKAITEFPKSAGVIPSAVAPSNEIVSGKTHTVVPQETLYGLSKTYNVSVTDLETANPHLAFGLKVGQVLTIPSASSVKENTTLPAKTITEKREVVQSSVSIKKETAVIPKTTTVVTPSGATMIEHVVMPGDTKWSISKKYDITIETIEQLNPESDVLSIGEIVKVPGKKGASETKNIHAPATILTDIKKKEQAIVETKVVEQDPEVLEFTTLKSNRESVSSQIKSKQVVVPTVQVHSDTNKIAKPVLNDLLKSANKSIKKELVMLLPFNLSKIEGDTIGTLKTHLNKDKFLNMTLDFYSGALIAIDSAGKLGIKINVRILDSEESKLNSNISTVISKHDFSKVNGIIGPFRQSNIKIVAEKLATYNMPVISPLSKESSKLEFTNLYNSIPTTNVLRDALITNLKQNNSNIVAVVDTKKVSVKTYFKENHKEVTFAAVDESGNLDVASLKALLSKDKMNYVVIESEKTSLILKTINTLLDSSLSEYLINIATTERNTAFDQEDIALSKLVKLRLHYPSITREDGTQNTSDFAKRYKIENTVFPNQYAIRGFDLTFDAILRLSQNMPFQETTSTYATEYIENRFSYDNDPEGGFVNKGVYVLRYEEDFTIKKVQ